MQHSEPTFLKRPISKVQFPKINLNFDEKLYVRTNISKEPLPKINTHKTTQSMINPTMKKIFKTKRLSMAPHALIQNKDNFQELISGSNVSKKNLYMSDVGIDVYDSDNISKIKAHKMTKLQGISTMPPN